jgi:DNA-binding HxlR family transcriptional regulator
MCEDDPTREPTDRDPLDPAVSDLVGLLATPPERAVVAALRAEGPLAESTLIEAAGATGPTVRECLHTLEECGLVRQAGDGSPRYELTDSGVALGPVLDAVDTLRRCQERDG